MIVRFVVATAILSVLDAHYSHAGFAFLGGQVESRAYSGLTPAVPTDKDQKDVTALPFNAETSASVGATRSQAEYDLRALSAGSAFRWDVAQSHDGAPESFSIAEGILSFHVDQPTDFSLSGDYSYSGSGVKRVFFRLYDTPADMNPIFAWDVETDLAAPSGYELTGDGELQPGIDYRLSYRLLLDNRTIGELGATSGNIAFTIGESSAPAQAGDTDGNGRVDLADLNAVRNNFGREGNGVAGDAYPFNGRVDLADLNAVRNHFGEAAPLGVPEPGGIHLALIGLLTLALGRNYARRAIER